MQGVAAYKKVFSSINFNNHSYLNLSYNICLSSLAMNLTEPSMPITAEDSPLDFSSSLANSKIDQTLKEKITLLQMYVRSYKHNYENQKEQNARLKRRIAEQELEYRGLESELKLAKESIKQLKKDKRLLEDTLELVFKEKEEARTRCIKLHEKISKLVKYIKKTHMAEGKMSRPSDLSIGSTSSLFQGSFISNQNGDFRRSRLNSFKTASKDARYSFSEHSEGRTSKESRDHSRKSDSHGVTPKSGESREMLIDDTFGDAYKIPDKLIENEEIIMESQFETDSYSQRQHILKGEGDDPNKRGNELVQRIQFEAIPKIVKSQTDSPIFPGISEPASLEC